MPEPKVSSVVNLSEFDPAWNWLAADFASDTSQHWQHLSTRRFPPPRWLPRRLPWGRVAAALASRQPLAAPASMLVSHGPLMTMYGALANGAAPRRFFHLAYSFNFTELPRGIRRTAMRAAFRRVDRFVVFSTMERALYARHFDIDAARIDMIHWGAAAPRVDLAAAPVVHGDYLCALGSQARDYATLFEAMRRLPAIRLVVVASPASVRGLHSPPNVDVRIDVPLAQTHNILAHARFMVLPLAGSEVPCGHVTLVAAMHLGKAVVATRSEGIADYLMPEVNGRTAEPHDADDLSRAIAGLWADEPAVRLMGAAGLAHAQACCSEHNVVAYIQRVLDPRRRASEPSTAVANPHR